MRRNSPKTAKRYRESKAAREALRERIPCCEWCGKRGMVALHEIPRAHMRSYVAGLPSCILGLCDPGCHQVVSGWKKSRQLALLFLRRAPDFSLSTYNQYSVATVTAEDVLEQAIELMIEEST